MADSATAVKNRVTVSDAGPCKKKLSIEIPADVVSERLTGSLDTLAHEAQLPGFRKGKAPRQLIEKRFGDNIRGEAKTQLVSAAYQAAVEEHKLKVVGEPFSEELGKQTLQAGKPFAFELEVEVMPEFAMPNLEGIDVRKPVIEVPDASVEDEVRKLCINEGTLESRETPEAGDYLTGHGIMTGADGTEFYNIKGCVVQVPTADKAPKGMILGVMVDDFSTQFGSPKAGQTATVKTTGPANHEVEKIRGAALTISFTVERVDRIIPAPTGQIVAAFGMADEAQLKEAIKGRLQQRAEVQQQVAMRSQIAQHLIDQTTMELPQRLTASQAARTLESRRMELMYRGVDAMQIEEHLSELRAASDQQAARELKLFFILNKVAEDLNVSVTEGEMNARIAQMAAERNVRPDKLRQEIIQSNRVGAVFQQIREHKTIDAILAKAKITEMKVDEYNEYAKKQAETAKKK